MVALDIATNAGLIVPDHRVLTVAGQRVLLVRRFDRIDEGLRVGYISARTLMGARELGTVADYGATGIGGRLRRQSIRPKADIERLWRQAALDLLINNTDNHLRNHGLLREGSGWTLAPVFDLDPNPDTGTSFSTLYAGAAYRSTGLRGLMTMARDQAISESKARRILDEVHQATAEWETVARGYGATDDDVSLFTEAFTALDETVRTVITPAGSTR